MSALDLIIIILIGFAALILLFVIPYTLHRIEIHRLNTKEHLSPKFINDMSIWFSREIPIGKGNKLITKKKRGKNGEALLVISYHDNYGELKNIKPSLRFTDLNISTQQLLFLKRRKKNYYYFNIERKMLLKKAKIGWKTKC